MSWPPVLDDYKNDQKIALDDARDDPRITAELGAAASFVQDQRPLFNYAHDPLVLLPDPESDPALMLGTIRLAARYVRRQQSPDGMVQLGDMGAARVSTFDPDIDRLLRIGRFALAVLG